MKTLPMIASEEEIKEFVLEWSELLAEEKYVQALDFILYDNTQKIDGMDWIWTPEKLEAAVFTYGMPWFTKEQIEEEYGPGSADYRVSSLLSQHNDSLLAGIDILIEFFDDVISLEKAKTWGISKLEYTNIIGEILYEGVPLNDENSDLTALFWIQKVSEDRMTLIFRDLHVM